MSRISDANMRKKTGEQKPIELFSTADGIRAIDSPVRVKIIAMLKEREMPFDEIVTGTGRAKSTVSVHLHDMARENIIGSRLDPYDRRKKLFYIDSGYIGGLLRDQVLVDDIHELFSRKGVPDLPDFFKIMLRTIRVELYVQGINVDPVLSDAGYKVGGALYEQIGTPDLDELLGRLDRFWSGHKLGRIEVMSRSPLTIHVYDCFECAELAFAGPPRMRLRPRHAAGHFLRPLRGRAVGRGNRVLCDGP